MSVLNQFFNGWSPVAYAALKAVALFITAAAAFRLSQRRTIAQFTPFDWVTSVAAGTVVGTTTVSGSTAYLTGTAALLTLITVHTAVARLRFIPWVRRVIDPQVRVLIHDGQLHHANMKRCGITDADLESVVREHGHRSTADISLALFESKGVVSVFTKDPS